MSVSCVQRSLIRRPPFIYPTSCEGYPLSFSFPTRTAQPVQILGLSHMCVGVKALLRKVGDPITELVVTRHEASLLTVEGMADVKCHAISIEILR